MAGARSASARRLDALVAEVRACTTCRQSLPLGPRPILSVPAQTRLLIIGQAPGTRVHESGVVWDDPSGDHLREWLDIDRETFYRSSRIGILPMGFCYPGKKKGGDAPPRPECAPLWHTRILDALRHVKLTLLVGRYAHQGYLPNAPRNGTETVSGSTCRSSCRSRTPAGAARSGWARTRGSRRSSCRSFARRCRSCLGERPRYQARSSSRT